MLEFLTNISYNGVTVGTHSVLFCVALMLAVVVSAHGRGNITNNVFVLITLASIGWVIANFLALSSTNLDYMVVAIRFVMVFASFLSALVLLFAVVFPQVKTKYSDSVWVLIWISIVMYAVLGYHIWSPLKGVDATEMLPTVQTIIEIGVLKINLVAVWGVVTFVVNIMAAFMLIMKLRKAPAEEQTRYKLVLLSMGATFILLPTILFLPVALYENTSFQLYGPLAYLPMFLGIGYAIVKHKIFNIQLVVAEVLVIIIMVIALMNVLFLT